MKNLFKAQRYINIISILVILVLGEACSSNPQKKETENIKTDIVNALEQNSINFVHFSFEEWVNEKCKQYSFSEEKASLIKEAFSKFQNRVNLYIPENTEYSIDFFDNEEDWVEYSNNILMGYISLKSLEQILNIDIMSYNTDNVNNTNVRIKTININYPQIILSVSSKEYIKGMFTQIDMLDIKKKEKKQKYYEVISSEILRNYSLEIERQDVFSQL